MSNEYEYHFYENFFDETEQIPQRPRSHELETESKNFLREFLPSSWIIHESNYDYGEDLRIEIFARGRATGLEFLVQVKATERLKKAQDVVIQRMAVKTVNYLLKKEVPSLLVVYGSRDRMAYFVWIEEYVKKELGLRSPKWKERKTVTFKIPTENSFQYDTIDQIVSYLFFRRLPHQLQPFQLINLLSTVSPMIDERLLGNWLKRSHYEILVKFLRDADVREMIHQGALTWDDISSLALIWDLSDSIKNAAVIFAQKMVMVFIETNDLDGAHFIIEALSYIDSGACKRMSRLWWKEWAKDPNLDLVIPMIEWLPEQPLRNKYIVQITSLLQKNFPIDMEDIGSGAFGDWLIDHSRYFCSSGKKLVNLLDFDNDTRLALHHLIDDWENEGFDDGYDGYIL